MEWQTPKLTSEGSTPTRNTETPSKTSSNPELSEAPGHTDVYPKTQTGKYPTQTKRQWKAEMERLNSKYNLNCFSDSKLDSESDEGEEYQHEHGMRHSFELILLL